MGYNEEFWDAVREMEKGSEFVTGEDHRTRVIAPDLSKVSD